MENLTTTELRKVLSESMSKCSFVSINGVEFFGQINDLPNKGKKLTHAVKVEGNNNKNVYRSWAIARNSNKFHEATFEGELSIATRTLNDQEKIEQEMFIIQAAVATSSALPDLINTKLSAL
jgi:hypothetical protein